MKIQSLTIPTLIVTSVFALVSAPSFAGYTGPGADKAETSLDTILKKPIDDQKVKLEGYLTKKVGKDKYIFSDGKNEVQVEIDDDKLPKHDFNDKDKITIYGEVDKSLTDKLEIDVSRVHTKK